MITKIRLSRVGKKEKPIYRIVVTPARSKRNGKSLDILGYYDPTVKPPRFEFNQTKYEEWLKKGAQASQALRKLLNEKIA